MKRITARQVAPWLWFLLALFSFRVIAQLLASQFDVPILPKFERWQSGVIPYIYLLLVQVGIIAWFASITLRFSKATITPQRATGLFLLLFGGLYFVGNVGRFILGLTTFSSHPWFTAHLPIFFHFVLASFVLSTGYFHRYGTAA